MAPSTYLALQDDQQTFNDLQVSALAQLGVKDASKADLAVFFHQARKTGLDPFSKQIYMVGRWDAKTQGTKWTIQAAIDGLRVVAQRTGQYLGQEGPEWCGKDGVWKDIWLEEGAPVAARVGVIREGLAKVVYGVARYESFVQVARSKDGSERPTQTWAKMPDVMLAKCAEAQALRRAFPQDLSGIYAEEEMQQATTAPADAATRLRAVVSAKEQLEVAEGNAAFDEDVHDAEVIPDDQDKVEAVEADVADPSEYGDDPETGELPLEQPAEGPAAARAALKKNTK